MPSNEPVKETKLRLWRQARGWTLDEVSALTGYSIGTFSRVERGQRELSPDAKVAISRSLGANIRDLFDSPRVEGEV